jgi:CRISPR system Cascade subunit CasC
MNLLELHILQSHAVFCGNRDDVGRPKTAIFGGEKRARISSQCLKRAIRLHMNRDEKWKKYFQAIRTKQMVTELEQRLKQGNEPTDVEKKLAQAAAHVLAGLDFEKDGQRVTTSMFFSSRQYAGMAGKLKSLNPESRQEAIKALSSYAELKAKQEPTEAETKRAAKLKKDLGALLGDKLDKALKVHTSSGSKEGDAQLDVLLPKPVEEIVKAMNSLLELQTKHDPTTKQKAKLTKEEEQRAKKLNEQLRDLLKAPLVASLDRAGDPLLVSDAADIALFGRMVASHHELTVEAAAMFSHALSTHKANPEQDFYTAVDDKQPEEDTGADMMGNLEYISATYYRYAALNLDLLFYQTEPAANLAHYASDEFAQDRKNIVQAFIEAAMQAVPSGRKTSMASPTSVDFALGVVRQGQPIQLVNAFDAPVRADNGSGFLKPSVDRLEDYRVKMFKAWAIQLPAGQPACFYPDAPADFASAKTLDFREFVQALVTDVP